MLVIIGEFMNIKYIKKRDEISPKGDGRPYVERAKEKYKKLTPEERAEVDVFKAKLDKILGLEDEDELDDD